jgi:NADH-quinone oxidoreductase subunit A
MPPAAVRRLERAARFGLLPVSTLLKGLQRPRKAARALDRSADEEAPMVSSLVTDYLPLVVFMAVSLGIGLALLIPPFVIAYQNPDAEKVSAYECGFNAFDDARMKFDVRFYLVSILFIIFDLEVAFLFPWAIVFGELGWFGFWSMMCFLGVLTIGFIYEWKKGALEWD